MLVPVIKSKCSFRQMGSSSPSLRLEPDRNIQNIFQCKNLKLLAEVLPFCVLGRDRRKVKLPLKRKTAELDSSLQLCFQNHTNEGHLERIFRSFVKDTSADPRTRDSGEAIRSEASLCAEACCSNLMSFGPQSGPCIVYSRSMADLGATNVVLKFQKDALERCEVLLAERNRNMIMELSMCEPGCPTFQENSQKNKTGWADSAEIKATSDCMMSWDSMEISQCSSAISCGPSPCQL